MFTVILKNGITLEIEKKTNRSGATLKKIMESRNTGELIRILGENGSFMIDPNDIAAVYYKEI